MYLETRLPQFFFSLHLYFFFLPPFLLLKLYRSISPILGFVLDASGRALPSKSTRQQLQSRLDLGGRIGTRYVKRYQLGIGKGFRCDLEIANLIQQMSSLSSQLPLASYRIHLLFD